MREQQGQFSRLMTNMNLRVREVDAGDLEHIAVLTAGATIFLIGLKRGGVVGALLKLGGTALLLRGQEGYRRLYDAMGVQLADRPTGISKSSVRVESAIVIDRPRSELYRIWRNLENLPVFMDHLVSVHEIDDVRSKWVAKAPAGMTVQWEAEIINDVVDSIIAWETIEGSSVDSVGSVHFDDSPTGGTAVRVVLRYDPPADRIGAWIARTFGTDPQAQIDRDLQRFKAIMEVGSKHPANLAAVSV